MKIDIHFSEGQQFTPLFEQEPELTVQFGEFVVIHTGGDWYDGDYEITSSTIDQTMPVQNKTMREDVTILAIPYAETINLSGGYTATIGE